ncbi:hypothetical protein AHF37_10571 [Paragonimus kellicotti]|nr:hypothetical protein AHF37_10571 [Paragonimus kellicotti]
MHPTVGVIWSLYGDFVISHPIKVDIECIWRALLCLVASVCDSMEFGAMVLPLAKLLLQLTISMELQATQQKSTNSTFPYIIAVDMRLHCFAETLKLRYGTVVCVNVEIDDRLVVCFIMLKRFRVPSINPVTTPPLELPAAVLVARLVTRVMEEVELKSSPTFWMDPMVIL